MHKKGENQQTALLIVAAGDGKRARGREGGGVAKPYLDASGAPLLRRALEPFCARADIAPVQIVIRPKDKPHYETAIAGLDRLLPPVAGGATRQASVRLGLDALAPLKPQRVFIHDAARAHVPDALIERALGALGGHDGVVPLLPLTDALKKEEGGRLVDVPRAGLFGAQTPQLFLFAAIHAAHKDTNRDDAPDDVALAVDAGLDIVSVAGAAENIKVTYASDIARGAGNTHRVGHGFDAHGFCAGDHVMLCGVRIPHTESLKGHSDADVALHALTDAILGAVAAGDIGMHFPSDDAQWKDAPSARFLTHALACMRKAGGHLVNADITLVCEAPKLDTHRAAMRASLAHLLACDPANISVKATTTDGLQGGIAAHAYVSVYVSVEVRR